MNPIKLLKTGQQYMFICPKDKHLAHSFPEIKIISYIKLAIKYMPPIVVTLFVWQYFMNVNIALIIITTTFAISLPIQGFFWLGKRANSPLPLNLLTWHNKMKTKLISKQILPEQKETNEPLNFIEFMKLLNLTKLHFGNYDSSDDENTIN